MGPEVCAMTPPDEAKPQQKHEKSIRHETFSCLLRRKPKLLLKTGFLLDLSSNVSNNDLLDSFGVDPYNGHEQQYVSSVPVAAPSKSLSRGQTNQTSLDSNFSYLL
jgi:hypothetical protein